MTTKTPDNDALRKFQIAVQTSRIISVISALVWFIASVAGALTVAGNFAYYQIHHNFGGFYAPFIFAPFSVVMLLACVIIFFKTGKMLGALNIGDKEEFQKLLSLSCVLTSVPSTWVIGGIPLIYSHIAIKKIDGFN